MNDFFGKEIKVGDVVELRADGNEEGSMFFKGMVIVDTNQDLALEVNRLAKSDDWSVPLHYLNMSNDIVKVESK